MVRHLLYALSLGLMFTSFACDSTEDHEKKDFRSIPSELQEKIDAQIKLAEDEAQPPWSQIRDARQKKLDKYLDENTEAHQAFEQAPIGFNGVPSLIFTLLPEVVPSLWNSYIFQIQSGLFKQNESDPIPYGMSFTKPPAVEGQPFGQRCEQELAVAAHGLLDRVDALGPAYVERNHHVRENHDIPQG